MTARDLVDRHLGTLSPSRRRSLGAHPTPGPLARSLVEIALGHLDRTPDLVVDPSCGAGSFLLAAADALVDRGVEPARVLGRLAGCDVDPTAVASCDRALRRWASEHGIPEHGTTVGPSAELVVADPLAGPTPWTGRGDLVVGNPPFLAQRSADTARGHAARDGLHRRFGPLGAYVDTSSVFLLVALELLASGGVAVTIQPQSVLAARDAAAVRARVGTGASLVAMWADDRRHFDAEVDVCAPVLRRDPGSDRRPVALHWGSAAAPVGTAERPPVGGTWAPLLATGLALPVGTGRGLDGPCDGAGTVGDVATVTAGFRDEFYALAAAARSREEPGWSASTDPLVTVGMVDVARLDRRTPRRLAGRRVLDPRLDRRALRRDAPGVAAWARRRSVPKVLVATQTRVPEAVADPTGRCVPVTPLISVEPGSDADVDVWDLLAVLCSPPVALHLAREAAGSGLSIGSIRVSAASLRTLTLPSDREAWRSAASQIRSIQQRPTTDRHGRLTAFGTTMCAAYGDGDAGDVVAWWCERAERA